MLALCMNLSSSSPPKETYRVLSLQYSDNTSPITKLSSPPAFPACDAPSYHEAYLSHLVIMASPQQSHKPRRRRKIEEGSLAHITHGTIDIDLNSNTRKPAFPLVAFLWPAKGTVSQWVTLPLILMVVGLFRWTTGFWGYSGISMALQVMRMLD